MSIMDRIKKNSYVKQAEILEDSTLYDTTQTVLPIPMLNVAYSGSIDKGMASGITVIAGPTKHFKSLLALIGAAAYLKKHEDACMIFYDSEFGMPEAYFESLGIDRSRVWHVPVKHIEELKFDMIKQLEGLVRGDKVVFVVDSIGNIASKKEVEDAIAEKSVADMTRAKALKSLFRMVTPYATLIDIPMLFIAHTYKEQGLFPKDIVSGGTGPAYTANTIFIMGRRQEKVGTEIAGYHFIINIEKSRFVKEKSKIPITVTWESGVSTYSGLLDVAIEGGYVIKPKNGWYQAVDPKDGRDLLGKNYRAKETESSEFWNSIFKETNFAEWISARYTVGHRRLINDCEMTEENVQEEG